MDINVKAQYIKQHINNIVTDDDAPIQAVAQVMLDLSSYIQQASIEFVRRRELIAASEAQTFIDTDMGDIA